MAAATGASFPAHRLTNLVTQPTLPDVALMIKLVPDMRLITVGATVTGWLARGVIGADEDRELVPPIHGTVVTVGGGEQSQPAALF